MNNKTKDVDFEVNLLPVLSVLSICICFLLTSAVWNRMGYIGINQAIGDELPDNGKNEDSIQILVKATGRLILQLRNGEDSRIVAVKNLPMGKSEADWEKIKNEIKLFAKKTSSKTTIVMPEKGVNYGATIQLLDQLKGLALNIGLAPAIQEVN